MEETNPNNKTSNKEDEENLILDPPVKKPLTVNELINMAGGNHKYQKILLWSLISIMFINGYLGILLPYIYFEPDFICLNKTAPFRSECTQNEACINPGGFEVEVHKVSLITLNKLYCDREKYKSWAIFIINFGASSIVFGCNILADKFGRVLIMRLAYILLFFGSGVAIFIGNFYWNTLFTFVIWIASDITLALTFIYFVEFSSELVRERSNAIFFYAYTFGVIFAHVSNIWIKDFRVMYGFIFFANFPTIIIYWQMKNTPFFLHSQKKWTQFKSVMFQIFQKNQANIVSPGCSVIIRRVQYFPG